MLGRALTSGLLLLLAVQYATVGGEMQCRSTSYHKPAAGAQHHGAPANTGPCPTNAPGSSSHHSTHDCMAMAGCTGTAAVATASSLLESPIPPYSAALRAPERFYSYTAPPETPPPIA